ncbi:hypothetical protein [Scytonema sp. PCC 10023]|uniref:hypothetical protein n=1 Tax=Scytonema sp. PCC 10023 TaxID=1680591 RepID=UPI0039C6DC2B
MNIRQHEAIIYIATGATNKQAADAVGVSISAIEKWRRNEDFQKLLQTAIQQIYSAAIAEVAKGAMAAAKELRRIAVDPDASDRVKISAISVLFSQLEKSREWELEARLERVERLLDGTDFSETQTD